MCIKFAFEFLGYKANLISTFVDTQQSITGLRGYKANLISTFVDRGHRFQLQRVAIKLI